MLIKCCTFVKNDASMVKISDLLRKRSWHRRMPSYRHYASATTDSDMGFDISDGNRNVMMLTQSDFMDELNPSSHIVNDPSVRAMRAKFRFNTATGKFEQDGWEDVSRVSLSLQESVRRHHRTTTFGNEMWFGSEGADEDNAKRVAAIRSYWSTSGMTDALSTWGNALFGTGDAAIYLHIVDGEIRYKVYSYENGDLFNFTTAEDGREVFVRYLMVDDTKTVEVYDDKFVEVWVSESDKPLPSIFLSMLRAKKLDVKSEDGYQLIKRERHGLNQMPACYHRLNDVVWGNGQGLITQRESMLSDLDENNKYYAYQIMFLTGSGLISLPEAGRMGKVMASSDPSAKASILEPADASNTFTIALDQNMKMLCETLGIVVLNPDELKAGENTGAFIQNLYWREVQWSMNMIADLRPAFSKIISVFKELVGKIEGDSSYTKTKLTYLLEPRIPKNSTEEVNNICMARDRGLITVETGSGELSFSNPREYEMLLAEKEAGIFSTQLNVEPVKSDPANTEAGGVTIDNKTKTNQ